MSFGIVIQPPSSTHERAVISSSAWLVEEGRHFSLSVWRTGVNANAAIARNSNASLVGRVRLDGLADLGEALGTYAPENRASSHELALASFSKWGTNALDRLAGDFCFVVWDRSSQEVTAVRDQLGVRPIFYGRSAECFLISDDLLWLVEQIDDHNLDHKWILDFLETGTSSTLDRTCYRAVRRLPPGHLLSLSDGMFHVRRYWSLDLNEPCFRRSDEAYVDEFRHLLSTAILDRSASKIGIALSGGLDSSTLASMTTHLLGVPERVCGYNFYLEHLIADDEREFSALVARHLNVRTIHRALDNSLYDPSWKSSSPYAEPNVNIINQTFRFEFEKEMSALAPVWFYGEGPDNALSFEWRTYLQWLVRQCRVNRLAGAAVSYLKGKTIDEWKDTFSRWCTKRAEASPPEPDGWLADFKSTVPEVEQAAGEVLVSSWRPKAMSSLTHPRWQAFFERMDTVTGFTTLDWRHPYLDLRVLKFMLHLPPIPWARRKEIIRRSMQGMLPDAILNRPKTPLRGDPIAVVLTDHPLDPRSLGPSIREFVDVSKLPSGPDGLDAMLRVHVLDHWLEAKPTRTKGRSHLISQG